MVRATVALSGFIALALTGASARGQGTTSEQSTYVPGAARPLQTVAPFVNRGTAVMPERAVRGAYGGGPICPPADRERELRVRIPGSVERRQHPHTLQSDNQTRRPGAANYTGSSFKPATCPAVSDKLAPRRSGHGTGEPATASIVGNTSAARTGSATTGRIPSRAPDSNERSMAPANIPARTSLRAIGGGPRPVRRPSGVAIEWREPRQAPTENVRKCP